MRSSQAPRWALRLYLDHNGGKEVNLLVRSALRPQHRLGRKEASVCCRGECWSRVESVKLFASVRVAGLAFRLNEMDERRERRCWRGLG